MYHHPSSAKITHHAHACIMNQHNSCTCIALKQIIQASGIHIMHAAAFFLTRSTIINLFNAVFAENNTQQHYACSSIKHVMQRPHS
jgi:hypothetical protein